MPDRKPRYFFIKGLRPDFLRKDFLDLAEIDTFSLKTADLLRSIANLRCNLGLRIYR